MGEKRLAEQAFRTHAGPSAVNCGGQFYSFSSPASFM